MIRWLAQEHPASCVVACIRMVLDAMGNHLSETTLRQFMGNPRFGLTLGDASRKLNDSGGRAEHHDDWGIDDLRDQIRIGIYPIVGVERYFFGHPFASHAVVVVTITTNEIVFWIHCWNGLKPLHIKHSSKPGILQEKKL